MGNNEKSWEKHMSPDQLEMRKAREGLGENEGFWAKQRRAQAFKNINKKPEMKERETDNPEQDSQENKKVETPQEKDVDTGETWEPSAQQQVEPAVQQGDIISPFPSEEETEGLPPGVIRLPGGGYEYTGESTTTTANPDTQPLRPDEEERHNARTRRPNTAPQGPDGGRQERENERGKWTTKDIVNYKEYLESEYDFSDEIRKVDRDRNAKGYYEKMSSKERLQHDSRRELARICFKKRTVAKSKEDTKLRMYANLEQTFKGLTNPQLDRLEEIPGYLKARKEFVSMVDDDYIVPEVGKTWSQCLGTAAEIKGFRDHIRNKIKDRVQQEHEDLGDFTGYSDEKKEKALEVYVQEAEQAAFNFLYAFNYFEEAKKQNVWKTDNKRTNGEQHDSWVVSDFIYDGMCPAESMVTLIIKSKGSAHATNQFQTIANKNIWESAKSKGIDISEGIDEIVVINEDNPGEVKRAWDVENFTAGGERKTRAYILSPYSSNTRMMPSLLYKEVDIVEGNQKVKKKLIDMIKAGERIDWTSVKDDLSKQATDAGNVDKYNNLMSGGKERIKFESKLGEDAGEAEYQRIQEWHLSTRSTLEKVENGLTAKGIRGAVYTNADLDLDAKLPRLRKARDKDTLEQLQKEYSDGKIFYDWDKYGLKTILSSLWSRTTYNK